MSSVCLVIGLFAATVGCAKDDSRKEPAAPPAASAPAAAAPAPPSTAPPSAPTAPAPVAAASPDAGAAAAAAPADAGVAGFAVGDPVYGKWTNDEWYPGKIAKVNPDGTYEVHYNDGDVSKRLPRTRVKVRKVSQSAGGGSRGGACSGGRTRCGSRCVDLNNDPNNCFECGRTCPEACMGGSCVSNAYKYGP